MGKMWPYYFLAQLAISLTWFSVSPVHIWSLNFLITLVIGTPWLMVIHYCIKRAVRG